MADIVLYHHIQGLTDGIRAFAEQVRADGHTVHTPDLFDGRTFATIEDGFAYAREVGLDTVHQRGIAAADDLGPGKVYVGCSFGVSIAQELAQTRPDTRGALFLYSCLPVTEFGEAWPKDVPVQIHGKDGDEFFLEDLPFAQELVDAAPNAELFRYHGDQHLFADSSLADYDPEATALLLERVKAFLQDI